jgi:UDP-glucose 4-epimerase
VAHPSRQRFLVTGGCGFIGSHLVDSLIADGHDVVVLDDLSSGTLERLDRRAELLLGDVADPAIVARAFTGVSGCFHLAAIASVARSNEDWVATHRTNQTGTICVLDAARRGAGSSRVPVVYASSAAVYGEAPVEPIGEGAAKRPMTAYGADKLGSELHARVAWTVHRAPTIGLRFFNVYGPRQDPSSPYSGVISIFADRLRAGLPITIHGDGSQVRDFVYVADAVRHLRAAMAACAGAGGGGAAVFNVCTGVPTAIDQLARLIGNLLRMTPQIGFAPRRPGDILRSVGSPELARAQLGVAVETTVAEGLRALLAAAAQPQSRSSSRPRRTETLPGSDA